VNADTSACTFKKKPVVVSGISGWSGHWTATGGSSVYSNTKVGYTTYLHQTGIRSATAKACVQDQHWWGKWSLDNQGEQCSLL